MIVNKWKLDWSSDNVNPMNLFFTMKAVRDAIHSGANTTHGRDGLSFQFF